MEAESALTASPVILKPGVGSAYSHAWGRLWKCFLELLLIFVVYAVISAVFSIFSGMADNNPVISIIGVFYGLLVTNPLGYGMNYANLKAAREESVAIKDLFVTFRENYWNAVLANLLVGVIVAVGFVLVIVPGIIFACKLMFVPYLVVDRKMEVIQAIKESWRMTNGHAWKIFLMGLLAIPIFIAGAICLGVGVIISIMWIILAFASLYHAVSREQEASAQPVE